MAIQATYVGGQTGQVLGTTGPIDLGEDPDVDDLLEALAAAGVVTYTTT